MSNPAYSISVRDLALECLEWKQRALIAESKIKDIHSILEGKFNLEPSSLTGEENAIFRMTYAR